MDRQAKLQIAVSLLLLLIPAMAFALEIKAGTSEELTIFLQNSSSGEPVTGSTCVLDIWWPNGTKIVDDDSMSELSDGFYVYTTNSSWTTVGNYRVLARCTIGADNVFSAMMFAVVQTTITEYFEIINETTTEINETVNEINATVNNIYSYLQNTVYPAVDTLEASLSDALDNQSDIYNKLVEIQSNVTTNYNEIINAQTQLDAVNASIMTELVDHRDRLIEINTTTWNSLNNITNAVIPKIDSVQSDTDNLQAELLLVKNYVDTLETGQSSISSDLSTIIGYVDSVEAGITNLDNDISSLSTANTARFDAIDGNLSLIYADTQSIITSGVQLDAITNATLYNVLSKVTVINTTTQSINSYLTGTVTTYLAEINATTHATYNLLALMNTTLNAVQTDTQDILTKWSTYNMSQIWTKLDSMDTQLDTIEGSSSNNTAILDAIAGMELILNDTRDELGFEGQSLTAYEYFVALDAELTSVNQSLFNKVEFEANATRTQVLNAIDGNSTAILNSVSTNNADINSILTKWGNNTAQDIIDNITTNRNQIISMQNWLDAFNLTEADRHNESQNLIDSVLNWLGIFNGTEAARHNATQTLINALYTEVDANENLSNQIIAQLGYSGLNDTLRDDIASLITSNNQILTLAQEVNLTTHDIETVTLEINTTVAEINETVGEINETVVEINETVNEINATVNNIYSYLQNTVYPAVDTLETSVADAIANQSIIYNKLIEIQANVSDNYNEIINAQTQLDAVNASIMTELVDHRNRLIELNTTTNAILLNITNAVIPKIDAAQTDIDDIQIGVGLLESYTDTLETGQSTILADLATVAGYTDSVEAGIAALQSDLAALNTTTDARFDAIDGNLSAIMGNVSSMIFNGVSLDSTTNATLFMILDLADAANTTINEAKDYLEGAVTNYLTDINETTTRINETITQINDTVTAIQITLADIQANITTLMTDVSQNGAEINNIIAKWGNYSAEEIFDEVMQNQAALTETRTWLDAFNATEADRHNESMTLGQEILNFLGVFNGTEAQRHNQTQALINALYAEIDANENLSNEILNVLGYTGKNTTIYDDLIALNNQNNQIITLAQEINLTTHEININVLALNTTVGLMQSDVSDILAKWGPYDAQDIMLQLNLIDGKIDLIQTSTNNTEVLNAIAGMESILNDTRDELGFEGQSLTAYEYFVALDDAIVNLNTTILNKIEFEANATRTEIANAIQQNTSAIINEINTNEGLLDDILTNWGNITAQDLLENITENRNTVIEIKNWLNAFNATEETRHNESMTLGQEILDFLGVFNGTEAQRHNQTQTLINALYAEIDANENLSNQIIAQIGYYNTSETLYEDVQTIANSLAALIAANNLTALNYVTLYEGVNVRALPKQPSNTSIEAVMSSVDGIYTRVDYYNHTSEEWLVYVPTDPFGNTLHTMETGRAYKIWVTEDCILIID